MEYLGAYSLFWMAAFLLLVFAIILFRSKARPRVLVAFFSLAIGLTLVYFYARPTQTPLLGTSTQVQALLKQGKPVLLEFQSPYCMTCIALKPVIDKLENEYKGHLVITRINIQDQIGMELKSIYGYRYTPTFIFIDDQGQEQWRASGSFDEAQLRAEMSKRVK